MGLFDAFGRAQQQVPGVYAPWMQPQPMDITPSQPLVPNGPLTAPGQPAPIKSPGLFSGWNDPNAQTGLTKWQQLQLIGAGLRDDPNVAANMQNSMMEQGKLALSGQLTRQTMAQDNAFLKQFLGSSGAEESGAPQSGMPQVGGQPGSAPPAMGGMPQAGGGGVPTLPGAHASPLTPNMRKALAGMEVVKGNYDKAATILDDRKKITAGPDGWLLDQDTGEVIGRLPQHTNQNGFNVDLGAANAPIFIPQLKDGMIPDGKGGVIPIPNYGNVLNQNWLATGGGETIRSNMANEGIGRQNAASNASNAHVTAANSGNVAPPPGFVIRSPK